MEIIFFHFNHLLKDTRQWRVTLNYIHSFSRRFYPKRLTNENNRSS